MTCSPGRDSAEIYSIVFRTRAARILTQHLAFIMYAGQYLVLQCIVSRETVLDSAEITHYLAFFLGIISLGFVSIS